LFTHCYFQLARGGLAQRRKPLEYLCGMVHRPNGISDGVMSAAGPETYDFGVVRVACVALLTLIALWELRSCGVEITRFSGHSVILRSSPTVFADKPMSRSASTCIAAGNPPSVT
jgi:hypothetical protein